MPISTSSYVAPLLMRNAHIQTLYPTLFRRVPKPTYHREKLVLDDGDFLDLDWLKSGASRLAIISHGMEGSSEGIYVRGMARALSKSGWDVLAWNFRGCGGTPNLTPRFYHSGASDDLASVVTHAASAESYQEISLVGFSMGGNITLKYLGEIANSPNPKLKSCVAISVPCDLMEASLKLSKPGNFIYMRRFLHCFKKRIQEKTARFPEIFSMEGYANIKDFIAFDNRYTAPIHGFESAEDYYSKCSSKNFISQISLPTLIINASDDSFLGPKCSPHEACKASNNVSLEIPKRGGHVGFLSLFATNYWSEDRATLFLNEHSM